MSRLLLWIKETRPQFLVLSVVLTFLGSSIAWYYGHLNIGYALLAGFGLTLTHGSVNAINDYFDYKSGIDLNVERTPFSGGSGLVPGGKISLRQALMVGVVTSLAAWQSAYSSCSKRMATRTASGRGAWHGAVFAGDSENVLARVVSGPGPGRAAIWACISCDGRAQLVVWLLRFLQGSWCITCFS